MAPSRARTDPDRGRFTDDLLEPKRGVGDPVADDPVATVLAAGGADRINALLHSIVHHGDPNPAGLPQPVAEYLETTIDLPDWADEDAIGRAQAIFATWGLQISMCLFCASLPTAYACAKGVRVLELTARLDTDARRRIMETGQFLMDVMEPGGLGPQGCGRRTIQRVRLMHAAVRYLITARAAVNPDIWDEEWGLPINQEDLAGTLLSFSFVPAGPLRKLGVRLSDREAEDYLHCWNVIGHQMGVQDELLADDLTEAEQLVNAISARQTAWSQEGETMTASLIALLEEMTPGRRADVIVPVLIRRLAGKDVANLLGVPRATARQRLLGGLLSLMGTIEYVARYDPVAGRYVERVAREMLECVFLFERGGERPSFDIPASLRAEWDLQPAP